MLRLTRHFRPLRPTSGASGTTTGYRRHDFLVFCRRIWNDGRRCCPRTSVSVLRDRLKFYNVRRTACQAGCIRAFLVVLNFVFLMCGCALVVFGMWLHVDRQSSVYLDLLHTVPPTGPLVISGQLASIFIVVGIAVSILSFLGCCGACADSACFLCLYILLLLLVLISEIVVGISTAAYSDQLSAKLQMALQDQIHFEYNKTGKPINGTLTPADHVTVTWDAMQMKLNCCGAVGPHDYRNSAWFNRTRHIDLVFVPSSCCLGANQRGAERSPEGRHSTQLPHTSHWPLAESRRLVEDNQCQLDAILFPLRPSYGPMVKSYNLKTQGCQRSIVNWFHTNLSSIASLACLAFVIQALNVFFACALMTRLRQRHFEGSQWSDESDVE